MLPKFLYLHLVKQRHLAIGLSQFFNRPCLARMHFPTLPKRWRLTSEANAKPPKYGLRKASFSGCSPSKKPPPASASNGGRLLQRSVSFSSDPVFKVPQVPARSKKCPNCHTQPLYNQQQPQQPPRSRSLVDLNPERPQYSQNVNGSQTTASIFSNNLRSNSWRNLSLIGKMEPQTQTNNSC